MSLHFAILFWLALIFLVAATFILVLMKKTSKESKKESYLSFTVILYIFGFAILIYT
ncbi:type II toxin-antitoxin system toxin TsaT, partial [Staphylococcus aureus]